LADPLWDRATRNALMEKLSPKRRGSRAPKGTYLLSGVGYCGTCGHRLYIVGRTGTESGYGCTARVRGIQDSQHCKPAPMMAVSALDKEVEAWFLARYGAAEVLERVYDPGTGHAARIAELEAARKRLREDRSAGLYDAADDAEWFRTEYARIGQQITELRALPERPAGMRTVPTGRTIADDWATATDDAVRRELLNEFDVRVALHPRGADKRVVCTGMALEMDADAA
jgi:hypothetical protein